MKPLTWLAKQKDGLKDLPAEEQREIMEFSLLWAYFEASFMALSASPGKFVNFADGLDQSGKIKATEFEKAIAYWRERYWDGSDFTEHYHFLNLRPNDNVSIVQAVLQSQDNTPRATLICALTIIYRYRNNLFHGIKWLYGLKGQKGNFETANTVLMSVAEMAREP